MALDGDAIEVNEGMDFSRSACPRRGETGQANEMEERVTARCFSRAAVMDVADDRDLEWEAI